MNILPDKLSQVLGEEIYIREDKTLVKRYFSKRYFSKARSKRIWYFPRIL